ncbi:MAG: LysR substrate-binding domain-containing protein [Hyphomicrobiales bacterium]|nr:LysR substrate-binding domain-containing protein [Hyphomicrobiales bacterium]
MDLNWLEDFVCFARTMNFTRAAQERNITQSAFSRRIQSLELWAGMALIDRKSYPARLSRAGEDFLPVAKTVLLQLLRTRDDLKAREQGGFNFFSFAAPHSVSIHHLMPMLHHLEQHVPGIRTRVLSDNLHTCCQFLTEGMCEFLMCYRHRHVPLTLDEQQFARLDIGTEVLVPVCDAAGGTARWMLPGSKDEPIPYLGYAPGSFLGAVIEHEFLQHKVRLDVRHLDAFAEALKSLALQGAGMAWLPKASVEPELEASRLVLAGGDAWQAALTLSVYAEPAGLSKRGRLIWGFFEQLQQA